MSTQNTQTTTGEEISLPGLDQPANIVSGAVNTDAPQDAKLSHSPFQPTDKIQWQFACETHKYIREFISIADNKAQWYIAFASAFLAWMNTQKIFTVFWSIKAAEWRSADILTLIAIIGLSVCIFFSLLTIIPRLKGSKKGIVYFASIAEHETCNDYLADVLRKKDQDIVIEKLRHVYELARVCNGKFNTLKFAVWSGGIGLAAGILLILMS